MLAARKLCENHSGAPKTVLSNANINAAGSYLTDRRAKPAHAATTIGDRVKPNKADGPEGTALAG
jgi:hypothetical protein